MPTTTMNRISEAVNSWGAGFTEIAGPMLIQSMVVAAVLLAVVWACSRTRAAFRYALLMLIIVKLLLPPSLSLPTGWAYWVKPSDSRPKSEQASAISVGDTLPANQHESTTVQVSAEAIMFAVWIAGIGVLSALILVRYRKVARLTGTPAPTELQRELETCRAQMGMRRSLRLETSTTCTSPAVCGLFRPVILIPTVLAEKLTPAQLRHTLLHELAHIQRGDLWVNHLQVVLQVLHWINPLLWLANAVIRRVREEAVDDLVMVKLGAEAQDYPATLVSVARTVFTRRSMGLSPIGIMESKAALKRRVARLVQNPVPHTVGLEWAHTGLVVATAAVLLPMARPNERVTQETKPSPESGGSAKQGSRSEITVPLGFEFIRALQAQGMTYEQFREKFVGNRDLEPGELDNIASRWMAEQKETPKTNTAATSVAGIEIQHVGRVQISDEQVKERISAKVGAPLNSTQVDADVRSLYASGLFSNVRVAQEQSPDGTILTYVVQARPRLEKIVFEGNSKVADGALREKLASRVGDPLDERKLFQDAQTIQGIYQRLSHPDAVVRYKVSNDDKTGDSTVTFEIRVNGESGVILTPPSPPIAQKIVIENNVSLSDVGTGGKLQTLAADAGSSRPAEFSPGGRRVPGGKTIRIWNVGVGKEVTTLHTNTNNVSVRTLSPDGRLLVIQADTIAYNADSNELTASGHVVVTSGLSGD